MRKQTLFLLLTISGVVLAACGGQTDGPASVEMVYLNHAPIRPAVQEVENLAAEYGDSVILLSYDFDSDEGKAFAEEHDLVEHTPIAVFVNGKMSYEIDGRSVKFYSFPQGQGTGMVADGVWTMDDLRIVLDQAVN